MLAHAAKASDDVKQADNVEVSQNSAEDHVKVDDAYWDKNVMSSQDMGKTAIDADEPLY